MGIAEKLEEIRKQPEHIRMRYLLACVFVCMVFVFFLWVVSLRQNFENMRNDDAVQKTMVPEDLQKAMKDIEQQSKEIKDAISNQGVPVEDGSQSGSNGMLVPNGDENSL